ncbi:NUDIX domain-containing protein [Patescibacteria group bacterium]|nr:NUDIX domain-containing protein [Patescibacteria group bacterium]
MEEIIIARNLDDLEKAFPMERNKFYEEQIECFRKNGKPSKSVDIVDAFLFNEHGELYIQKRAKNKAHNPRLLDKSLGGHVNYGDTIDYTVMVETVQELQVPSIVLKTHQDYKKTHKLLKNYLNTIAIMKQIDTKLFWLEKKFSNESATIANYVHLFIGVYSGRVKTVDRESSGILHYTLEDLYYEMETVPAIFTPDLHTLTKKYRSELEKFQRTNQLIED